jgi:hypothetical protein
LHNIFLKYLYYAIYRINWCIICNPFLLSITIIVNEVFILQLLLDMAFWLVVFWIQVQNSSSYKYYDHTTWFYGIATIWSIKYCISSDTACSPNPCLNDGSCSISDSGEVVCACNGARTYSMARIITAVYRLTCYLTQTFYLDSKTTSACSRTYNMAKNNNSSPQIDMLLVLVTVVK